MTIEQTEFDWTHARSLVAVIESGSLSAAARTLGQSQPTLGRHIKELEQHLGVELFTRVTRGLAPTPAALDLLPHAQDMAAAAAKLQLAASGKSTSLQGTIRITASVVVSHFVLPPILAQMREALPEIQIELVPSDATENLLYREADIAIRMYRPEQLDIIARHICDEPTALYAATSYLGRKGRPSSMAEISHHDIIGFDKSDLALRTLANIGVQVSREFFSVRCDDQAAYWHLLRAGCGIGAAQCRIADNALGIERVLPEIAFASLPFWLAAPEALRSSPRIRAVWDFLAEHLPSSQDH